MSGDRRVKILTERVEKMTDLMIEEERTDAEISALAKAMGKAQEVLSSLGVDAPQTDEEAAGQAETIDHEAVRSAVLEYVRTNEVLDTQRLGAVMDTIDQIDAKELRGVDLMGAVEDLERFSQAEAKISETVRKVTEMIESNDFA